MSNDIAPEIRSVLVVLQKTSVEQHSYQNSLVIVDWSGAQETPAGKQLPETEINKALTSLFMGFV